MKISPSLDLRELGRSEVAAMSPGAKTRTVLSGTRLEIHRTRPLLAWLQVRSITESPEGARPLPRID